MLTQLLSLLDEGRAFSLEELAQRLAISEDAMKAQMEYLERLGILRRVQSGGGCKGCSGSCGGACGGCGKHAHHGPAMWEKAPL